jgi:hypothetical protein
MENILKRLQMTILKNSRTHAVRKRGRNKKNCFYPKNANQLKGKRSQLQISQCQKPKRTSKNLEAITTSKVAF